MAQKQYIKYLYEVEDKSLRKISRLTGHSFETVKKYAYQTDWNENNLPDTRLERHPVLGPYIHLIDSWLEADKKVPKKQRHTAWRIYTRLRDEYAFEGSYSSVKKYVHKKKYVMKSQGPGYVPLENIKGAGQVDFGENIYIDENDNENKGYALAVSFVNSNKGYTQFFPSQNQECLLEGMKRIFEHIGGVPSVLRLDNMSTAVARILEGGSRKLTDGFERFMLHYRLQAEFCNPACGNEKGNVENKVGYSRRNAFVPVPHIISFEEFFYEHTLNAAYKRSYEKNHTFYDWTRYVSLLCKKPRAVENARFFDQMPKLWQKHLKETDGKKKDALKLLKEIVLDGNSSLCDEALEMAYTNGRTDADSLRQRY